MDRRSFIKDVRLDVGDRTALITMIDEKDKLLSSILLEVVWVRKHWWSMYYPAIRIKT